MDKTGRAMNPEKVHRVGQRLRFTGLWLLLSGVGSCGAFWTIQFTWQEPLIEQLGRALLYVTANFGVMAIILGPVLIALGTGMISYANKR